MNPKTWSVIALLLGLVYLAWSGASGPAEAGGQFISPIIISETPFPPTPTPTRFPDTTPPETTITVAGSQNRGWYYTPVVVTFRVIDNWAGVDAVDYTVNDVTGRIWGDQLDLKRQAPLTITQEGRVRLTYQAFDRYANTEPPHAATFDIDLTPPVVTPTLTGVQAGENWYRTPPVTITLMGQDGLSGLDYYEANLNSTGWTTMTAPYVVTAAGYHRLDYRAADRAGNLSAAKSVVFFIGQGKNFYLPLIFNLKN